MRYALEDLSEAELLVARSDSVPRHACWLSQQAAEKTRKSVLVLLRIPFPRKHDLDHLRNLIPEGWSLKESYPDLAELTEWAVEARYPGDWPEAIGDEAQSAVDQARSLWETVLLDFKHHGFEPGV
jgi:HEPN domain-containing protein